MSHRVDEHLAIIGAAKGALDNQRYEADRAAAIAAHRRLIRDQEYRKTPEYRFMSELDNPCPDLYLRSMYRKEVLSP